MKHRKSIVFGALLLALCMIATGCSKKVTVESLFEDANKKAKEVESVDMDIIMDMECEVEAEGVTASMAMKMDVNAKTENEKGMYMDGKVELDMFGSNMSVPVKTYTVMGKDKNTVYTYDPTTEAWTYAESEAEDLNMNLAAQDYSKISENMTLAEETEEYSGKECYKVSGTIKGGDISNVLENMGTEFADLGVEPSALEGLNVKAEYYFDKEKKELSGVKIDFSDSDWEEILKSASSDLESVLGEGTSMTMSKFEMEMKINESNGYEFKLPADVKDKAVEEGEASDDLFALDEDTSDADVEEDIDLEEDDEEVSLDAANSDLEVAQGIYIVDGKQYTLLDTIEAIENDGWVFDSEYNSTETIAADDYETLYFTKGSNSIGFTLTNDSDEEKSYKEATVTGVTDSDLNGEAVLVVDGISIGSSYDDVIATFGEAEDPYEDGDYKSLDYSYGDLTVSISLSDDVVDSILVGIYTF